MAVFLVLALSAGAAEPAPDAGWEFSICPYAWAGALDAKAGVGDLRTDVNLSTADILSGLDMAGMLSGEARKNRWGVLLDGLYGKYSTDIETPGPFFNTIDTTLEMGVLDLALAYRVVAGERGWMDLLVGARYYNASIEMDMNPDYAAVDTISSGVMNKTVKAAGDKVGDRVSSKADDMAQNLAAIKTDVGDAARDMVREEVSGRVGETVDDILGRIDSVAPPSRPGEGATALALGDNRGTVGDAIRGEIQDRIQEKVDDVGRAIRDAIADAVKTRIDARITAINQSKDKAQALAAEIRAAADESINDLKKGASKQVQAALDRAQRQLAGTIQDGMEKAAATDISADQDWVDPYVGGRARLNLTTRTYLGARADIGGFDVGSRLTWQLFGGAGFHATSRIDLEAGWRCLDVDYENESFALDMTLSGFVVGARILL